jgi:hypothetical protein
MRDMCALFQVRKCEENRVRFERAGKNYPHAKGILNQHYRYLLASITDHLWPYTIPISTYIWSFSSYHIVYMVRCSLNDWTLWTLGFDFSLSFCQVIPIVRSDVERGALGTLGDMYESILRKSPLPAVRSLQCVWVTSHLWHCADRREERGSHGLATHKGFVGTVAG